jgi:hypothetical protein
MENNKEITLEDFMKILETIVSNSNGQARIAFNEEDDSTKETKESKHFLKVNEKRLSRNLEFYVRMAKISPERAFVDFSQILFAIKKDYVESFNQASILLKELVGRFYKAEMLDEWNKWFVSFR